MHVLGASSIPNLDVGIVDHAATVRAVEWGAFEIGSRRALGNKRWVRRDRMHDERSRRRNKGCMLVVGGWWWRRNEGGMKTACGKGHRRVTVVEGGV